MSTIVPSGDAIREERVASKEQAIDQELAEVRAEARVMRDAAFLAYGALVALVGKSKEARIGNSPMVNTVGAEDVIARLESVLFPSEPAEEPLPPQKSIEQARVFKQAFEGHFGPGEKT